MDKSYDSTERTAADFVLVGIGFLAFLFGATGLVATSPALAMAGGLILLGVLFSFALRS